MLSVEVKIKMVCSRWDAAACGRGTMGAAGGCWSWKNREYIEMLEEETK